jgi:predicted  nucleic acid-binding Zn-ribbon protein
MPRRPRQETTHSSKLSAKVAYSKSAQKKLAETRSKLAAVNAQIRSAMIAGQIDASEKLEQSQRAVDVNLAEAEAKIERLRKSDEDTWEAVQLEIETAWEDLSHSVKKLVARFSDGSRS